MHLFKATQNYKFYEKYVCFTATNLAGTGKPMVSQSLRKICEIRVFANPYFPVFYHNLHKKW